MLPLSGTGKPAARLKRHAAAYAEALQGEFGKVQLAVISECISKTGSAEIFYERYLDFRRTATVEIIAAGQQDGSIGAAGAPEDLFDAIYGSLFYRYIFGIKPLSAAYASVDILYSEHSGMAAIRNDPKKRGCRQAHDASVTLRDARGGTRPTSPASPRDSRVHGRRSDPRQSGSASAARGTESKGKHGARHDRACSRQTI